MAIWIRDMKIYLPPIRCPRFAFNGKSVRYRPGEHCFDIRHVENDSTPPTPMLVLGLLDEVQVRGACAQGTKGSRFAPEGQRKSEGAIKLHSGPHIVGSEGNRAHAADRQIILRSRVSLLI